MQKLISDFERLEDKVLLARDTLDDAAQQYVQGIGQLVPLVSQIGSNVNKIREVVDTMKSAMDVSSQPTLKTSAESVRDVQAEIDSLN